MFVLRAKEEVVLEGRDFMLRVYLFHPNLNPRYWKGPLLGLSNQLRYAPCTKELVFLP